MRRGWYEEKGRMYATLEEGVGPDVMMIIVGPPEGAVDELGLLHEEATKLHNVLYNLGVFSFKEITSNRLIALGALQEAFGKDPRNIELAQKLVQAYFHFQQEPVNQQGA